MSEFNFTNLTEEKQAGAENTHVIFRFEQIPPELQYIPHWVCWHYGKPNAKGRRPKVTLSPKLPGVAINYNDPSVWVSFAQAVAYAQRRGISGIGFVLSDGDMFSVYDFDDCFDERGNLQGPAADLVPKLHSYTEISVSGKGLHVVVKGKLAPNSVIARHDIGLEVYSRNRFIAMTGNIWRPQ